MKKSMTTRQLTLSGLFVALSVILSVQNIYLFPPARGRITLRFLPVLYGGIVLGPIAGGCIGAVADVLTYLVTPGSPGAFFPGYTLTAFLMGFFPSYVVRNRDRSGWLSCSLVALVSYLLTMGLDSYWLKLLSGQGYLYFLAIRAVPNLAQAILSALALKVTLSYRIPRASAHR